jgi:hypothetical protein
MALVALRKGKQQNAIAQECFHKPMSGFIRIETGFAGLRQAKHYGFIEMESVVRLQYEIPEWVVQMAQKIDFSLVNARA